MQNLHHLKYSSLFMSLKAYLSIRLKMNPFSWIGWSDLTKRMCPAVEEMDLS